MMNRVILILALGALLQFLPAGPVAGPTASAWPGGTVFAQDS